jgi:thiamine kinase-like enzyme
LINALKAEIPLLAEATKITKLEGGLTNLNYKVDTPQGSFVMRVSSAYADLLGINRNYEKINTEKAFYAGVGAEVIDWFEDKKVLIIRWIEAKTLESNEIQTQPNLLKRIASSMKTLHAGPEFYGTFHFPTIRKKYLSLVLESGYFIPKEYLEIAPLVEELEKVIDLFPEKLVPCNNDLLAGNFMDDGKKIWIIDYEYAGQNEASFEIGNFASEVSLNNQQLNSFCNFYWGKDNPEKIARAKAWSMIARYGWIMWASIQEARSPIDFDFNSWGMEKWTSVLPEFKGPTYTQVLKNLNKCKS